MMKKNNKIVTSLALAGLGGLFYLCLNKRKVKIPDYETVLVFGENHDYLWILSREKTISTDVKQKYLNYAQEKGYNTANLTWTIHD